MATTEKPDNATLQALAAEVMDLWQEHLAAYASDPAAKAELMRLLEPQRRLFADWAAMMQNDPHGTGSSAPLYGTGARSGAGEVGPAAAAGTAAAADAFDDSALRLAQLAHRLAELEKRVARLESGKPGPAAKTPHKTTRPRKS